MRTTVYLDDATVKKAKDISGLEKTSHVINVALNDYIRRNEKLTIIALGGTYKDKEIHVPPRRAF